MTTGDLSVSKAASTLDSANLSVDRLVSILNSLWDVNLWMPGVNVELLLDLLKRQFPMFSEGCSWFYV